MQDAFRQGMHEARATEEDLDAFMADHEALLTAADAFEPLRNAGGTLMEAFADEPDRLYGELLWLCRQVVQTMYENACAGCAGKYVNLFACAFLPRYRAHWSMGKGVGEPYFLISGPCRQV